MLENLEEEKNLIMAELQSVQAKNAKELEGKKDLELQLKMTKNSLNDYMAKLERLHEQLKESVVRIQLADELVAEWREKCQEKEEEMRSIQQNLIESNVSFINMLFPLITSFLTVSQMQTFFSHITKRFLFFFLKKYSSIKELLFLFLLKSLFCFW